MPAKQSTLFHQKSAEFPSASCASQVTAGLGMKESCGSPASLTLTCHTRSSPDPSSVSALCVGLSLKQSWHWESQSSSYFPAGCCNHQAGVKPLLLDHFWTGGGPSGWIWRNKLGRSLMHCICVSGRWGVPLGHVRPVQCQCQGSS